MAVLALVLGSAAAVEPVTLQVREHAGVARADEPVTTGLPFAQGTVTDAAALALTDADGRALPAQFRSLATWPDGSLRWALMDTQVSLQAGGAVELRVVDGTAVAPRQAVRISEDQSGLSVDTGPMRVVVGSSGALIESLSVGGAQLIAPGSPGLVVVDSGGEQHRLSVDELVVEERGPLRSVILLRGTYPGVHDGRLRCTTRLTVWAGQARLGLRLWLENHGRFGYVGQPEWVGFDRHSLDLDLELGALQGLSLDGQAIRLRRAGSHAFRVAQHNPSRDWSGFRYHAQLDGTSVAQGARSDGVLALRGSVGTVTVALRHFWQNYDKAIAVDGGRLRVELWPGDGAWPPVQGDWTQRGGGDFERYRQVNGYHLPGSVRKGHELLLDFSGRAAETTRAAVASPLMALATPEHYAATAAAPGVFAPVDAVAVDGAYAKAQAFWNASARDVVDPDSASSLFAARRGEGRRQGAGSWYGWMDFGDHPWGGGMSSLHYDWTWITLLNYLRLQDPAFGELGVEMARHLIEVDHGWSEREHPGLRWLPRFEYNDPYVHGGLGDGHCKPIPTHAWAQGIVLHYFLSGDPMARECAMSLGAGLRERSIERLRTSPTAEGQARESGWGMLICCALYDLTADRAWLEDGLVLFRNHQRVKWQQQGTYHDGGLQYYYGAHGLCELHRRSGDPELLAMLEDGARGSFTGPEDGEWRIFLAEICAYVGQVQDDPALIAKAEELFAGYRHFERPVCYNGNQAWDKESGKYLRNGHILQHVRWQRHGAAAPTPVEP